MEEHSSAKPCRRYEAANGKSPKYTLHLKIVIHEQAVFPAVRWPQNPSGFELRNVFHRRRREPGLKISQPCPACFDDHPMSFSTHGATLAEALRDRGRHLGGEGIQIHGSTLATQLRGNKRREAATPADPTPDHSHTTCIPFESSFDSVRMWGGGRGHVSSCRGIHAKPDHPTPTGFK